MMEWIAACRMEGIVIGVCTFLIIGLFHPVVVKAEYYWGTRCWWLFLLLGFAGIIGSIAVGDILLSSLLGVFSFSSFWTINATWDKFILPKPFSRVTVEAINFDNPFDGFASKSNKTAIPTLPLEGKPINLYIHQPRKQN